jgi:hypothetical protein
MNRLPEASVTSVHKLSYSCTPFAEQTKVRIKHLLDIVARLTRRYQLSFSTFVLGSSQPVNHPVAIVRLRKSCAYSLQTFWCALTRCDINSSGHILIRSRPGVPVLPCWPSRWAPFLFELFSRTCDCCSARVCSLLTSCAVRWHCPHAESASSMDGGWLLFHAACPHAESDHILHIPLFSPRKRPRCFFVLHLFM